MRRKDREITDIDKIETIIASARYMHLGMFDGEFLILYHCIMATKWKRES